MGVGRWSEAATLARYLTTPTPTPPHRGEGKSMRQVETVP
jgi:hypothetical protein